MHFPLCGVGRKDAGQLDPLIPILCSYVLATWTSFGSPSVPSWGGTSR
jgi:hypothetical protein